MKRTKFLLLFVVASALLFSCGGNTASTLEGEGDTIPMQYAKNITMVRYGDCVKVELANPWGEGLLGSYILVPSDSEQPQTSNLKSQTSNLHLKPFLFLSRTL